MVITHAHSDHVGRTAARLARENSIPVYMHKRFTNNILAGADDGGIRELDEKKLVLFHPSGKFRVGEFLIFSFQHSITARACVTYVAWLLRDV